MSADDSVRSPHRCGSRSAVSQHGPRGERGHMQCSPRCWKHIIWLTGFLWTNEGIQQLPSAVDKWGALKLTWYLWIVTGPSWIYSKYNQSAQLTIFLPITSEISYSCILGTSVFTWGVEEFSLLMPKDVCTESPNLFCVKIHLGLMKAFTRLHTDRHSQMLKLEFYTVGRKGL